MWNRRLRRAPQTLRLNINNTTIFSVLLATTLIICFLEIYLLNSYHFAASDKPPEVQDLAVVFKKFHRIVQVGRSFTIDHENNTFLMDGKPFRYVSGSFHYFRALPGAWEHRLRTMRAAGLNVLDTYVEWSTHNPKDGFYDFMTEFADIARFLELAEYLGFYIILRPGPYICAERDNGGLPYWLFNKYPNIRLRTNDSDYTFEVERWYKQLMPRMQPFLYGNGGPIIMVQVENEYGAFPACDYDYLVWLRDLTESYVKGKALLFTTDIPDERMSCGKIEGVFATTDFGYDRIHEVDEIWKMLRKIQPTGPLVNSEFYPGWLTHWQEENQRRDAEKVADALRIMLDQGASVNFYMFFGGTNFGFTAGANDFGVFNYTADITSYDYDAPMDEAGGVTTKFQLIRNVIANYFDSSKFPDVPKPEPRISYGEVDFTPIAKLLDKETRSILNAIEKPNNALPLSFEELDMYSGLVLYETTLPKFDIDPTLLTVNNLRDRALVLVDHHLVGTLSRGNNIYSIPLNAGLGSKLQLIVENQGRINFNVANDTKGIFGAVTIQKRDGEIEVLKNWNTTGFTLHDNDMRALVRNYTLGNLKAIVEDTTTPVLYDGPTIYYGQFIVTELGDTYLNTAGWGKGVAYVNGFNIGRYWPLAGPQLTMYVPSEVLNIGVNGIALLELQRANRVIGSKSVKATLDDKAQLDA